MVGFDHVDIKLRDRAKARRFFVEQLGMDVIGESAEHTFLLFGDQVLGLHDAKAGETPSGVDHIAIRVSEWTGLRNRVARARVVITGEKERSGSRSLFLGVRKACVSSSSGGPTRTPTRASIRPRRLRLPRRKTSNRATFEPGPSHERAWARGRAISHTSSPLPAARG